MLRKKYRIGKLAIKLVDNLAEGLHKGKCRDCKSCLEYVNVKDSLLIFDCLNCNKN